MGRRPRVLAIDAGGTMTDTFLIDASGEFVVGKAQSKPEDESRAFLDSLHDALGYWGGMPLEEALRQVVSGVYSGTAMLNRLLTRKGRRIGLLVTAGQEDALRLERGVQTYLGYSYSDRLHVATHTHNEPLVPRERIRGIRGRIDLTGEEVFPLYEDEVEQSVKDLLEQAVESICICFMHSYRNPMHELAAKEIAENLIRAANRRIPVFASSELWAVRGDLARLNTLVIEAYAAEPSREQLVRIKEAAKARGAVFDLRVMASHGGTISTDAKELARTLVSGPIGGAVGARHLAAELGKRNVVCTDIGGTSFDMALITEGDYSIKPNPDIARFLVAIPLVRVDSIGAGTGSFVRVNPSSNRIEIGPDSAGCRIGICWPEGGVETPTITDCHVVLGHINPEYFLGGEIRLDPERARAAVHDHIAEPLGLKLAQAAAGVLEILEDNLKNQVYATIVGRGYEPVSYTMLSYGGGGPLHVAGYTEGVPFEDILIPSWAAGFSAYGCACADLEYRFDKSVDYPMPPGASDDEKTMGALLIDSVWSELKTRVAEEFAKSGIGHDEILYRPYVRMQYLGQLNDLEFRAPVDAMKGPEDIDRCIEAFEELYGKVYALAAKSPELGFLFTTAVMAGSVEVEKPLLPRCEPGAPEPPPAAWKMSRRIFWRGHWHEAGILEMEALRSGNRVFGPAVIESPSTTLMIPPGRAVTLDEHRIFHMTTTGAERG
jgi:acetone carboxylase beta subunit